MANKVSFSGQELDLNQIAKHHVASEAALREYFSVTSPSFVSRYAGEASTEVENDFEFSYDELDYNSAFSVMASVEAALRTDYLSRVYWKKKDALSRAFRDVEKEKGHKASLEDDILSAWLKHGALSNGIYSDLLNAFKYRHWLAHGRYWTPKFHKQYDYFTVSVIAQELLDFMDSLSASVAA